MYRSPQEGVDDSPSGAGGGIANDGRFRSPRKGREGMGWSDCDGSDQGAVLGLAPELIRSVYYIRPHGSLSNTEASSIRKPIQHGSSYRPRPT
jgi:hypothetical protein